MRIMIVDDNTAMRKVLSALFKSLGHELVCALADGVGVEDLVLQTTPDLVCLDYHLPNRNGLTILRGIQTVAPHVDVVFMTASSEPGIEARAADAGASGFIRKPFGPEDIVKELKAIEETRRLTQASAQRAQQPTPARSSRRGTAIIADDNGAVRLVLKALLEASGLRVVQMVANGAEAVQAARTHRPDIVCLDLNMPVMDGLQALPLILEASPESKVVMVTGTTDKKTIAQAAGLGASGYLVKPLRPAYVEAFILKLLGSATGA